MKINGKTVTANEMAKLEILRKLAGILASEIDYDYHLDGGKHTEKDIDSISGQLWKREQSIRNLLGADKLNEKFGTNY